MPDLIPREIFHLWLYVPPALVVALVGLFVALLTARFLNRTRLARWFWHPPLAFLGFWVLSSSLFGLFFLRP